MRRAALVLALAAVAGLAATALAAPSHRIDPRKAAAVLVRNLRPNYRRCGRCGSFGAAKVVHRHGALWFGVGSDDDRGRERFRIYRWNDSRWRLVADVKWHGWGSAQWPRAAALTGSPDPDFAIEGCGAADTNCLSVVSDISGRWRVVPFEYGYGRALVVNGLPAGHLVQTEVDACSCAGGPSTWTYERYSKGVFRPAPPRGGGRRARPHISKRLPDRATSRSSSSTGPHARTGGPSASGRARGTRARSWVFSCATFIESGAFSISTTGPHFPPRPRSTTCRSRCSSGWRAGSART